MPRSEVYNCDCLEYMKGLPDKYFSLAIADPPYGDAGQGFSGEERFGGRFERYRKNNVERTGGTWAAKYEKKIAGWDVAPTQEFFDELERVSENRIIWGANYFIMPPTRCFVVWKKLSISESFSMAMAEYAWTSFNGNAKVVEMAPQGKKGKTRFHPTQKPVELYSWLLKNYASGGVIFDPMMGSASSRIAAYKLGLDYVGCEIDKEYFDKGVERFEKECKGITRINDNTTIQQLQLFE